MKPVKVSVESVVTTIKANREKHRTLFLEAQKGYRDECIRLLDERLEELRNRKKGGKINMGFFLPEPCDHTEDYDRVISMLEWSVDKEVDLTEGEFSNYVLDNWAWSRDTFTTNMNYSNIGKGL